MASPQVRAFRFYRQGLDGSLTGLKAQHVLAETGWSRSVGGANPYLCLFGRAGLSREDVDADAKSMAVYELPAARGCTYVLPEQDYVAGLRCGASFTAETAINQAIKYFGISEPEINALMEKVCVALESGDKDPRELKSELGDAVRSFGDEGKKRGTSTSLPLALGRLRSQGRIVNKPITGRFDTERYTYSLWRNSPAVSSSMSAEEAHACLAQKYFQWAGPATLKEFQWFSGLTVAQCKTAIAASNLSQRGDSIGYEADLEAFESFQLPNQPHVAFVGCLDNLGHLRRSYDELISTENSQHPSLQHPEIRARGGFFELNTHYIVDRGEMIGLWDFDPSEGKIVWLTFTKPTDEVPAQAQRLEAFINDQLGDVRSFSLDSPASRQGRLNALRQFMN